MQPRTEALVGLAALALLATLAGVAGSAHGPVTDTTADPSTFLAGPGGARGLLEALQRMGIGVRRFRERTVRLPRLGSPPGQILVILDPTAPISAPELKAFVNFAATTDLLVAGYRAEHLMRCFGYKVVRHPLDSVRVDGPGATAPRVAAVLVATGEAAYTDSSRLFDVTRTVCHVPAYRAATTLLSSPRGAVAIRLDRRDSDHAIILVADAALFENRQLRETDAGPFALGLFAGHYTRAVFEEYHHGYGASGSLGGATLEWSRHSPWGWAVWQLVAVGVLALLFGAVRFGPVRPGIVRRRRSQLEHVRALATALAAASGHDEAIAAMVRGLRRRLVPPALRTRGDWRAWLAHLNERAASPDEREAIAALASLTRTGQPSTSVLQAANAVEDLWKTLHH
jgi:hypothetical protein